MLLMAIVSYPGGWDGSGLPLALMLDGSGGMGVGVGAIGRLFKCQPGAGRYQSHRKIIWPRPARALVVLAGVQCSHRQII